MGRPFHKHLDEQELNALVPSFCEGEDELPTVATDAVREVERHVELCRHCSTKVAKYRQIVDRSSDVVVSEAVMPGPSCPSEKDVEWHEVAAGLWPEHQTTRLIMHAALCDHCGPLLRAATPVCDEPTPEEEQLLARLRAPSRPLVKAGREPVLPKPGTLSAWWQIQQWKTFVPAAVLVVIIGVIVTTSSSSRKPLTGSKFAELAVSTHRKYAQGNLPFDVRPDSLQALNEWLKAKSPFPLALPASPGPSGEEPPYRLEGARLVQVGDKTAAYIGYQMQPRPVGLMVTPDSVASASGGVEVDFSKVSFHYRMVDGYKVVTWSQHGLTYALVSQEGNNTQRSCMVCHSPLRDRDLTQTPTPMGVRRNSAEPVLQ